MSGSKPIYFWDRESIITLIKLYEMHPCLYLVTHANFEDRNARYKALQKITSDYNRKKFTSLTVEEIQKKIKDLRTQYFADVERIKECKRLGIASDRIIATLQWFFKNLEFLLQPCDEVNDLIDNLESLPTVRTSPLSQSPGPSVKRRREQDLSEDTKSTKHIGFTRFVAEELEKIEDENVVDELKEAITELIFSYKRKCKNIISYKRKCKNKKN